MILNANKAVQKTVLLFILVLFTFPLAAGRYSPEQQQGFDAYRKNDWTSAMFFLRKAGSSEAGYDEETLYMLVMSEMNGGEYNSALSDANLFLQNFNSSMYASYMQFQKGRALHFLGKNEDAVLVLSDFCHLNQDSELYASSLYWIAECFYAEYNFDSARALYERVVEDFPSDSKVTDSRYRLEMIAQREREEKLIYLLKVTGEENLAAKEDYERQIKLYQAEDKLGLRKALADAESKIADLQAQLSTQMTLASELSATNAALLNYKGPEGERDPYYEDKYPAVKKPLSIYTPAYPAVITDPEVELLKRKAEHLQYLLDEQKAWEN